SLPCFGNMCGTSLHLGFQPKRFQVPRNMNSLRKSPSGNQWRRGTLRICSYVQRGVASTRETLKQSDSFAGKQRGCSNEHSIATTEWSQRSERSSHTWLENCGGALVI